MQARLRFKMKIIKNIVVNLIHWSGYDIYKIPKTDFSGLDKLNIKTIIDIGANRGQFARRVFLIFPEAKIFCFEPVEEAFDGLKKWAESSGQGRVFVFNVALGDKEEEKEMFLHLNHTDSSSMLQTTKSFENDFHLAQNQKKIKVNQYTLDTALEKLVKKELEKEVLVKMDVQGYEGLVISGAKKILLKSKACIIEIVNDEFYKGQPDFKKIFFLMDNFGFKYYGNLEQVIDHRDGHITYYDAIFIKK